MVIPRCTVSVSNYNTEILPKCTADPSKWSGIISIWNRNKYSMLNSLLFLWFSILVLVRCPAGTFTDNAGDCQPCPIGTFSVTGDAGQCTPCPAGTWTRETRSQEVDCIRKITQHLLWSPLFNENLEYVVKLVNDMFVYIFWALFNVCYTFVLPVIMLIS